MNTETTDTTVARSKLCAALAKAQGEFPVITRARTVVVKMKNGGTYTFDYAPLDVTLAAVRPALARYGLALYHEVGLETGEAPRVAVEAVLVHEGGGELRSGKLVAPFDPELQALGSATTYLKRYTAEALLGVCAEQDDDGNAASGNGREMRDRGGHPPAPKVQPAKSAAAPTNGGSASSRSESRSDRLMALNGALVKLNLGGEKAAKMAGEEKKRYLLNRWLQYIGWAVDRDVMAPDELSDDELAVALTKARHGEIPA